MGDGGADPKATQDLDGGALPLGTVIGGFRILDRLGAGSMGAVYRARQLSLERDVALKVLPKHMAEDPEYAARFHREARIAGSFHHPNLVRVFEVSETDGWSFYAMELVDGGTLAQLVRAHGPVDERRALRWLEKLAGALGEAHRGGVVHRDVKPDNVLISSTDEPKLADLGLAKRTDGAGDITASGEALGTPSFMAPEQARGEPVDGRTDLYALGATMFFALTGRHVFEERSPHAALLRQATEDAPRARQFNPRLSRGVDNLLAKLLARDRDARPADAAALCSDIARVERERTSAPPPMRPGTARLRDDRPARLRDVRRRRRGRGSGAGPMLLALVAVIIAAGTFLWLERHPAEGPDAARLTKARALYEAARRRVPQDDHDYAQLVDDLERAARQARGTSLEGEVAAALAAARAGRHPGGTESASRP